MTILARRVTVVNDRVGSLEPRRVRGKTDQRTPDARRISHYDNVRVERVFTRRMRVLIQGRRTTMVSHGTTPAGRELTDEVLEEMAAEAERGLDISKAKAIRRGPGRPRIGADPGEVFPVRLGPELRRRLDAKAVEEGRASAAVVRDALQRYLESSVPAGDR